MAKKYVPRGQRGQPHPAEGLARKVSSVMRKYGMEGQADIIDASIRGKDPQLERVVQEQVREIDLPPGDSKYNAFREAFGKATGITMEPCNAEADTSDMDKENKQPINKTKETIMSENKSNTININIKKENKMSDNNKKIDAIINSAISLDMNVTSFNVKESEQRLIEIAVLLKEKDGDANKREKEAGAIINACLARMTDTEIVAYELTVLKLEQSFFDSIETYFNTDGKKGKTLLWSAIENLSPHRCVGDEWETLLTKRGWGIGVHPVNQLRKDGRRLAHRAVTTAETAATSVVSTVATVAQANYFQLETVESIADLLISGVTHLFGGGSSKKKASDEE
jgi:hypothetical protein